MFDGRPTSRRPHLFRDLPPFRYDRLRHGTGWERIGWRTGANLAGAGLFCLSAAFGTTWVLTLTPNLLARVPGLLG